MKPVRRINVHSERCIGCRVCEQWCTWQHNGSEEEQSRIYVQRMHSEYSNLPQICHQCVDTPCIEACRFDALCKNETTGSIQVDRKLCTGCRACVRKCPYQAISFDSTQKKVRICDLCAGEPQCVRHCPERVLEYNGDAQEGMPEYPLGLSVGLWSWRGGEAK